jgi:hypothetical protein
MGQEMMMTEKIDTDRLTNVFVKIRDSRAELKKAFEAKDTALKAQQTRIENAMLAFLNDNNMNTVATNNGTFYKQEDILPTGSDWGAFYAWVKENDAFEALERRIKKTFVTQFMDDHDGELPPGVSVLREWKVIVRRKS